MFFSGLFGMYNCLVMQVSPTKAWLKAVRPFSLSASIVPVLVGTSLAVKDGKIDVLLFLLTLFGAVLIQIGTNLADEYSDHVSGSYKSKFLAPHKVILSGLLAPSSVMLGVYISMGIAGLIGIYLVMVSGWPILAVGVASIAAAYFYSSGPKPLGNLGLGEPLVFVFMGLVAVTATYYVQTHSLSVEVVILSIPVACLVTAILVANNLRDVDEDKGAGKVTLATLYGLKRATVAYITLVIAAYGIAIIAAFRVTDGTFFLAPVLSLPLGISLIQKICQPSERANLNKAVKGTAIFHLLFGVLLSTGILASRYLEIISK